MSGRPASLVLSGASSIASSLSGFGTDFLEPRREDAGRGVSSAFEFFDCLRELSPDAPLLRPFVRREVEEGWGGAGFSSRGSDDGLGVVSPADCTASNFTYPACDIADFALPFFDRAEVGAGGGSGASTLLRL